MLYRHDVGDHLVVWTQSKEPGRQQDNVIISAHGISALVNGMDSAPKAPKLHFYSPHGFNLNDPSIASVAMGNAHAVTEPYLSQDYALSKYTNTNEIEKSWFHSHHNKAKESYKTIAELDDQFAQLKINYPGLAEKFTWKFDIITLRNRPLKMGPKLSSILKDLWSSQADYHYKNIHCALCRGTRTGKTRLWNSETQTELT